MSDFPPAPWLGAGAPPPVWESEDFRRFYWLDVNSRVLGNVLSDEDAEWLREHRSWGTFVKYALPLVRR